MCMKILRMKMMMNTSAQRSSIANLLRLRYFQYQCMPRDSITLLLFLFCQNNRKCEGLYDYPIPMKCTYSQELQK